jgi:hypothetical protein
MGSSMKSKRGRKGGNERWASMAEQEDVAEIDAKMGHEMQKDPMRVRRGGLRESQRLGRHKEEAKSRKGPREMKQEVQ